MMLKKGQKNKRTKEQGTRNDEGAYSKKGFRLSLSLSIFLYYIHPLGIVFFDTKRFLIFIHQNKQT